MSYYGGTVTVAGRNLITSLMAGKTIEFTRIMVGSGSMPDGFEPIDMTNLVSPIAEGVSSVPSVENGVLSMLVEYRNDLNGGLKEGFWLREFGVYAKTEDTEEILLYYATLGDSPQPVNAYKDNRIDIRRYPITIALELDANIQVTYNPGAFITSAEAEEMVRNMVMDAVSGVGSAIIKEITIPAEGWVWDEQQDADGAYYNDRYYFKNDVPVDEAKENQFPNVALSKAALEIADEAGLCPTVQTLPGMLRFWSRERPREDMTATIALMLPGNSGSGEGTGGGTTYVLPVATATRLGGVKIGKGISVADDGTINVVGGGSAAENMATSEDTEKMLDEVFANEEGN